MTEIRKVAILLLYLQLAYASQQTLFKKSQTLKNVWKPKMQRKTVAKTASECAIFCVKEECDIFALNAIAKKCYCGKMNETSDPLSISSIDTDPFDVYSYPPVDCTGWNSWKSWKSCPCGGATQTRIRTRKVEAQYGGSDCVGGFKQSQNCSRNCMKGALVVGGTLQTTEVIDLANSSITLDFKELPSYQTVGVGGVLGDKPIICGGNDNNGVTNYCLRFENETHAEEKWTSINVYLNNVRSDIASIQLQPNRMWIIGGLGYSSIYYDSTEFIDLDTNNSFQRLDGPKLPHYMKSMCAVKVEEQIYIIGGQSKCDHLVIPCEPGSTTDLKEVWIYNSTDFKDQHGFDEQLYEEGPSMARGRYGHACGLMKNGNKSMIVAAGGWSGSTSVEILDLTTNEWSSGPSLPNDLTNSAMISSPDDGGVIVAGGNVPGTNSAWNAVDRILELRADGDTWNEIGKLNEKRYSHVLIPIPDSYYPTDD